MLAVSSPGGSGGPLVQGGLNITPSPGFGPTTILPWIATARRNETNDSGEAGNVFDASTRTATTCYMKGLSEQIEIQTNSAIQWQWRRICFTYKNTVEAGAAVNYFRQTTNGMQRYLYNITSGTTTDQQSVAQLRGILFRGSVGVDWNNYMTAPVDTSRVTIKYDKTRTIASGNDSGVIRKFRMWHPMNANLVYDDEESGGNTFGDYYSVSSKPGMGDYYVVDLFLPSLNATSTDALNFNPTSTLYWHEK